MMIYSVRGCGLFGDFQTRVRLYWNAGRGWEVVSCWRHTPILSEHHHQLINEVRSWRRHRFAHTAATQRRDCDALRRWLLLLLRGRTNLLAKLLDPRALRWAHLCRAAPGLFAVPSILLTAFVVVRGRLPVFLGGRLGRDPVLKMMIHGVLAEDRGPLIRLAGLLLHLRGPSGAFFNAVWR